MKIRPQKQAPQQPSVDLENAETMRCEKCDNPIFIQGYIVKKISAITSPKRCPESSLKSRYTSRSMKKGEIRSESIHPQKGKMEKINGTDNGKFLINDCL